jgi:signal transduction histidine kinase
MAHDAQSDLASGIGGPPGCPAEPAPGAARPGELVDRLPVGIHLYALRPDGALVFEGANATADRILGVENARFVGLSIEAAFPPLAATEVPARYRETAAHGTPWHTEKQTYEHGEIRGAFDLQTFQVSPGHMGVIFTDITERKRAEAVLITDRDRLEEQVEQRTAELRTALDDLVRSEREAALGRLMATVSHELSTPLQTVRAAIFNIGEACLRGDRERVKRVVEIGERNIVRCTRILGEMLDYIRTGAIVPQEVALDPWLDSLVSELVMPTGVELVAQPGCPGLSWFDPDLLGRAVRHVVVNALQAMDAADPPVRRLVVATRRDGERVEVRVRDSGPGLSSEARAHLFEPLFSTREVGVGLGLSIVRKVVERHGGGVRVDDVPEGGTEVVLWISVARTGSMPGI